MHNSKGFTLIELMIVVVILSLLASIAIPNFIKIQDRAKEAKVNGGAHTLQLAAEDFAVQNDGTYSDLAADIRALLPANTAGNNNLQNAFLGTYVEPQWGAVAAAPGNIGIQGIVQGGVTVGYTITGFGKDATQGPNGDGIILTLTNGQ